MSMPTAAEVEKTAKTTAKRGRSDSYYTCQCGAAYFGIKGDTIECCNCGKEYVIPHVRDENNILRVAPPAAFNKARRILEQAIVKPGKRYIVKLPTERHNA